MISATTLNVPVAEPVLALLSFAATATLLVGWIRFGLSRGWGRNLVAVPNARSSHTQTTPTGGGIAVVLVLSAVLLGYFFLGITFAGWLALGCVCIAILGLVDDLLELSPRLRMALQIAVVSLLLWSSDAVSLSQSGWPGQLPSLVVALLWGLALVWFLNLFNFMDGIDGLATAQSGSYCLAAVFLMLGDAGWYTGVLWAGVGSSLGFALFNVAPARIFMGDVGSSFWGILLGVLALQLAIAGALPLVASLILLSAFWFDATYTLLTRMVTGQRFTEGHRSHLYQRLADRYGHARTTGLYLALFVLWQWPLAAWIRAIFLSQPVAVPGSGLAMDLWWIVALSCLPLLVGCIWLRAGRLPKSAQPRERREEQIECQSDL